MSTKASVIMLGIASLLTSSFSYAKDDQGVNDYSKAAWNPQVSCVPFVRKYESVCGNNFSDDPKTDKYDWRASSDVCSSLSLDQRPTVEKGQIITVYLNQAYVNDFTERWEGYLGKKRGEIAVVARVAELDEGSDFDFSNSGTDRGRLVYYSEGVQPGQFLNFSQLPIYGPIEYMGKPLAMEFYIMELDVKENTEVSGLLSAAAGLGAIAYPPASPILKVLDTIGSGLLKANKSDLEFKYHAAILAGELQLKSLKAGTLEYANYAFVRMSYTNLKASDVSNIHTWSRWFFNQKNGRLYSDPECSTPLLEHTYFSVQINRAKEAATLDSANTLANFMTKLTAEANSSSQKKEKIIDALKASVADDKNYKDARKLIDHANQMRWPNGDNIEMDLDLATKAAIERLAIDIDNSLKIALGQGGVFPARFDEARANALVEALSRLIGGKTKTLSSQAFVPADVTKALK